MAVRFGTKHVLGIGVASTACAGAYGLYWLTSHPVSAPSLHSAVQQVDGSNIAGRLSANPVDAAFFTPVLQAPHAVLVHAAYPDQLPTGSLPALPGPAEAEEPPSESPVSDTARTVDLLSLQVDSSGACSLPPSLSLLRRQQETTASTLRARHWLQKVGVDFQHPELDPHALATAMHIHGLEWGVDAAAVQAASPQLADVAESLRLCTAALCNARGHDSEASNTPDTLLHVCFSDSPPLCLDPNSGFKADKVAAQALQLWNAAECGDEADAGVASLVVALLAAVLQDAVRPEQGPATVAVTQPSPATHGDPADPTPSIGILGSGSEGLASAPPLPPQDLRDALLRAHLSHGELVGRMVWAWTHLLHELRWASALLSTQPPAVHAPRGSRTAVLRCTDLTAEQVSEAVETWMTQVAGEAPEPAAAKAAETALSRVAGGRAGVVGGILDAAQALLLLQQAKDEGEVQVRSEPREKSPSQDHPSEEAEQPQPEKPNVPRPEEAASALHDACAGVLQVAEGNLHDIFTGTALPPPSSRTPDTLLAANVALLALQTIAGSRTDMLGGPGAATHGPQHLMSLLGHCKKVHPAGDETAIAPYVHGLLSAGVLQWVADPATRRTGSAEYTSTAVCDRAALVSAHPTLLAALDGAMQQSPAALARLEQDALTKHAAYDAAAAAQDISSLAADISDVKAALELVQARLAGGDMEAYEAAAAELELRLLLGRLEPELWEAQARQRKAAASTAHLSTLGRE